MAAAGDDHRPVWLLDVDGVLNAVTAEPDRSVWSQWRTGRATARRSSWVITWAPGVVDRIDRLHRAGVVTVCWLTTWEDAANRSLGPLLGLPTLTVAGRAAEVGDDAGPHGFLGLRAAARDRWWKLAAARRFLDPQPHRALVWTDDDLVWEPDAREWAERRPSPTLLIAPATGVGLTPKHLDVIERFCSRGGAA